MCLLQMIVLLHHLQQTAKQEKGRNNIDLEDFHFNSIQLNAILFRSWL